ncbi:MAG: type II CRISPR RNA-guided endonuclease Cas9 [Terriglobia bacterium]
MENVGEFVLGLDLGTNSLGWAIVRLVDGVPAELIRAGARVFQAGVNIEKDGTEKTLNAERREARHRRRQTWRRARRLARAFNILQRGGLLPAGDVSTPPERQRLINELDQSIRNSEWFKAKAISKAFPEPCQTLPYILRAAALDERLWPEHFGRALYHLAQRRGFWSNRKRPPGKKEEAGPVESDSRSLDAEMTAAGRRTLGEHFALLSPFERRIRGAHTSRRMYQDEFSAIWRTQSEHYPGVLTEDLRRRLFAALFDQRPAKLRKGLVGRCEFEPELRRAPAYSLAYQRFRLLQVVNNFKYRVPGGAEQDLTNAQRAKLISKLERMRSMKFKEVRELLGLTKRQSINLQRDKEEAEMPGNDTGAQLFSVLGERWSQLLEDAQVKIAGDAFSILSVRDLSLRERRAEKYLRNRSVEDVEDALERFLNITFEDGYGNLSLKAIARFMPLLERGFPYGALSSHYRELTPGNVENLIGLADTGVPYLEACERVVTAAPERHEPLPLLPPVSAEETSRRVGVVRNPIVIRSLTELRKVVNAVIERFGLPARVHVELLRELKKPKDARERIWKENFSRDRVNKAMREEIWREAPIPQASPRDIEKLKLWHEADRIGNKCPYCLTGMSKTRLFGDDSEYQVDHIIPRERSLDDSYVNKVLCHADCNARKGNRTPWEAFAPENGGDPDHYDKMLRCVDDFAGDKNAVQEKLRRFKMNHEALDDFLKAREARQFNDSAYASRLAADYVALLYGGRADTDGNLRVQVRSGGLTHHFREAWGLNSILEDGPTTDGGRVSKRRDDHRNHAVDAAVIAVTDQGMATRLNEAARRKQLDRPGRFGHLDEPWDGFRNELRAEVLGRIVVSHRVSKKVSGSLHKDTNYSVDDEQYGKGIRRHRVFLTELSEKDVMSDNVIADPGVRRLAQARLSGQGGGQPKKVFAEAPLSFDTADGPNVPIRKVRINETVKTRKVGKGYRARFVKPESNHHLEVYAILDPENPEREMGWSSDGVVTVLEALQRLRDEKKRGAQRPTPIKTDGFGEHTKFKFSVAPGEILECDAERNGTKLIGRRLTGEEEMSGRVRLVVKSISQEEKRPSSIKVEMVHIADARQNIKFPDRVTKSPSELFKWNTRKIVVSPLGEVFETRD